MEKLNNDNFKEKIKIRKAGRNFSDNKTFIDSISNMR